jgi:hypothetical protein
MTPEGMLVPVPVLVIVTFPVEPLMLIPEPAVICVTPVLVRVIEPVEALVLRPVLAVTPITPVFVTLTAPVAAVFVLRPELVVRLVTPVAGSVNVSTTLVPLHKTILVEPLGIVIPEPAAVLRMMLCPPVVAFFTT